MSANTAIKIPWQPLQWQAVTSSSLPADLQKRQQLKLNLDYDLHEQFRSYLTPQLASAYDKAAETKTIEEDRLLANQFDRFLVSYAAERFGPRLLLCESVVRQLMRWEEEGSDLLGKFLDALRYGAQVRRGLKPGRLSYIHKSAKKQFVSEFKRLKQQMKQFQSSRHRLMTIEDLVAIIEETPDSFALTLKSVPSLKAFNLERPAIVKQFLAGIMGPGAFVSEWMAWQENITPKHLQNRLSRMG